MLARLADRIVPDILGRLSNNLTPKASSTIAGFLKDINYFEEPRKFVNIGVELDKTKRDEAPKKTKAQPQIHVENVDIDEVIDILSHEVEMPTFDINDASLTSEQLMNLAIYAGIYRDLFGSYRPRRGPIHFTVEQAQRMSQFVPYHWITDQPFARSKLNFEELPPLPIFMPVVNIKAKFFDDSLGDTKEESTLVHTAYHGNFIPASEAFNKPAIVMNEYHQVESEESMNSNEAHKQDPKESFHSVILVNLDSIHDNTAMLHWMITDIKLSSKSGHEVCKYLPCHGIRGFGYSRYVFVALRHNKELYPEVTKIDDYTPSKRKFSLPEFIDKHRNKGIVPVGLSWFQTSWDISSNRVFHDYLNLRSPEYEYVQPEMGKRPDQAYPGKVPFNIFLDHCRNKRDINEQVLLERLKIVDSEGYQDQYCTPEVPRTAIQGRINPIWLHNTMFKKNNRLGYWRGLRPASATLPLNNNADLDYPIRPLAQPDKVAPDNPNKYPAVKRTKPFSKLPSSRPVNEFHNVFVQDGHENWVAEAKMMMEKVKKDNK